MRNYFIGLLLFCFIGGINLSAQTAYAPEKLNTNDYQKAERALRKHTDKLVDLANVRPIWINPDEFFYVNDRDGQLKHFLVNAKNQKVKEITDDEARKMYVPGFGMHGMVSLSPDGLKTAFIRDYNLWVRHSNNQQETQLTFDGEKDFGYATNNAGWTKDIRPVLLWSPDSKKIATFQHDGRGVGEMHLVTTNVGHPKLESWKYPMPEDSVIFRIHRVIVHVDQAKIVRLQMEADQHRSGTTDHIAINGEQLADAEWSADSKQLMFLSISRDHKAVSLKVTDASTGKVNTILDEKADTFFESGIKSFNWRFLPESNEFIWFSQKSNWGHLYLYDISNGKLKNQITKGDWNVLEILKMDMDSRKLYFIGCGKEVGDPYFQYLYSVKMDGTELSLLTPDSANHIIQLSPTGHYFIDTWSTPQNPPVVDLRSFNSTKSIRLGESDISKLLATGWKAPTSFSVKARDGETDLYGLLFKPLNFDPDKKYPIINYIYPGPQSGSVGSRSFSASHSDKQALADLGFVVISLDAMGTPMRSKSFHDAYYGNMGDNGLPDQITGMKQLANKYSWIDIDRVGIYGHSGGGYASTNAILRFPDFFDVAVSGAGNYDNQANQLLAKNLKGKLLLAHGTMDRNVPVYNTLLVVEALIAANKDFDLILFPNRDHGFGGESYMIRKKWDYFVKHLLGAEPPKEFTFSK